MKTTDKLRTMTTRCILLAFNHLFQKTTSLNRSVNEIHDLCNNANKVYVDIYLLVACL